MMSGTALNGAMTNGHEEATDREATDEEATDREVTDQDLDRLLAVLEQIGSKARTWRKHRKAMRKTNRDSIQVNLAQHDFHRAVLAFSDDPAWAARVKAWHEADEAMFLLMR